MAPFIRQDPWLWSVNEVGDFFKSYAHQALAELPGARLPPLPQFTDTLIKQEITGAFLMLYVDRDFLSKHCNVTKFAAQNAVVFCIDKLKANSDKFKSRDAPITWEESTTYGEPMQLDAEQTVSGVDRSLETGQPAQSNGDLTVSHDEPVQPLAAKSAEASKEKQAPARVDEPMQLDDAQPATTQPSAHNIGENARPQETIVNGPGGKKRRHLNLIAVTPKPAIESGPADYELYLPEDEQPIDKVFFGNTLVGNECGPLQITDTRFVNLDDGGENFEFIGFKSHAGLAQYIDSQWRRFSYTREEEPLRRRKLDATARFPYHAGLQAGRSSELHQYDSRGRILFGGSRSALVFQHNKPDALDTKENPIIAVREDQALLRSGARELGFSNEQMAQLDGPSGHLLLKYPPAGSSEVDYEEEEGDGASTLSFAEESTNSDDDMAEVSDGDEDLNKSEVKEIIEAAMEKYIATWQEHKLAALERKSAWTTWRKTKRSKALRDQLIQGARNTVQRLENRLRMFVKDMENAQWDNKSSLEKQCECLQVTVEDIQVEHWKIEVWQRKKEPEHVVARSTAHKHASSTGIQQAQNELQSALRAMGPDDRLSVSPQVRSSPPRDLANSTSDFEGDHFHTPQGSPVRQPDHESFVVPDDHEDVTVHASTGASRSPSVPGFATQDKPASVQPAQSQDGVPITPTASSKIVKLKTPTSSSRFREGLQNLSTPKHAESETRPIELGSSPFIATPHRLTPAEKAKRVPNEAGRPKKHKTEAKPQTSEADSWSFEQLAREEDRERILQKHLRDLGLKKREEMHNTFKLLKFGPFKSQLLAAQELVRGADFKETSQRINNSKVETMKLCARLLVSWFFVRPDAVHLPDLPQDILKEASVTDQNTALFMNKLQKYLGQRYNPLYSGCKPTSLDDPMIIDTDDESATPDAIDTTPTQFEPTKKRRKVEFDRVAEGKRKAARARLERTQQQQQSSNPAILEGMMSNGASQGEYCEINLPREPDQEPIYLHGKLAKEIKPYQLQGIQFMWCELTSDLKGGKGSLLAHTMGLGKTMQSIALLTCVDEASKSDRLNIRNQLPRTLRLEEGAGRSLRFLVICPPPLVQNWCRELKEWAPQHNIYRVESSAKSGFDNLKTLQAWSKRGGVLLIGYHLFRSYVHEKEEPAVQDKRSIEREILLEKTDLVIADEAHYIKNTDSSTSKAVTRIKTAARVALSGTPMSNDVDEIYALVSWVDPGYLGDKKQFSSFYGLPIKEGLYADSLPAEKRNSTIKLKNLHGEIEPKINRADISVLKGSLKPKVEFVLTVELTELQRQVYAMTVAALIGPDDDLHTTALTRIFSWLAVLGHLTAHPRIYRHKLLTPPPKPKKRKSTAAKTARISDTNSLAHANDDEVSVVESEDVEGTPEIPGDESAYVLGFTEAIVNELLKDVSDDIDPTLSAKTRLLQQILQLSKSCGDKVLIFSSHIPTLDYLSDLFQRDKVRFRRIDGSVPMLKRTEILADFQKGHVDVMLISTRAGGQGLNMQEANRVVIFDFGFNPAWEEQAIGRAYRLGQTKPVFVYRFVAGGTFESNIYNTQIFKTTLMKRVVDKKSTKRQAARNTKEYLYAPKPVNHQKASISNELELDRDPHVMSRILQAQVNRGSERDPSIDICNVLTMEVLQAEAADEPFTAEEERMFEENKVAWKAARSADPSLLAALPVHARGNGLPSSTAPVPVSAPTGMFGAVNAVPATQVPSIVMPQLTQAVGHAHATNTTLAPRDIRNQAASADAGRAESMGGLPFVRSP